MHCVNWPLLLVFSAFLAACGPQFSAGPSRVSKPPSMPFSIGLNRFGTLLKVTGSGGYLKTYWEVNSSTIWLASSSCKSTSWMLYEHLNTKGNFSLALSSFIALFFQSHHFFSLANHSGTERAHQDSARADCECECRDHTDSTLTSTVLQCHQRLLYTDNSFNLSDSSSICLSGRKGQSISLE